GGQNGVATAPRSPRHGTVPDHFHGARFRGDARIAGADAPPAGPPRRTAGRDHPRLPDAPGAGPRLAGGPAEFRGPAGAVSRSRRTVRAGGHPAERIPRRAVGRRPRGWGGGPVAVPQPGGGP